MLRAFSIVATLMLFLLAPALLFAQAASYPASLPSDLSTDLALQEFLQTIGGMKGAGALGIAFGIVQLIMVLLRSPLGNVAGRWKLLIAIGFHLVAGVLALISVGVDWKLALMHGNTLAAIGTFIHQLVKQFTEPKRIAAALNFPEPPKT